jgi:hypothetical protein
MPPRIGRRRSRNTPAGASRWQGQCSTREPSVNLSNSEETSGFQRGSRLRNCPEQRNSRFQWLACGGRLINRCCDP